MNFKVDAVITRPTTKKITGQINRGIKWHIKNISLGNSRAAQWLGTLTARTQVRFLVKELRSHKPYSIEKKKLFNNKGKIEEQKNKNT